MEILDQIAADPAPILLGGLGGAALVSALYGIREWPRWRYRWRRERRIARGDLTALNEPEEIEEYLPYAPTEEDRRNLPLDIVSAGLGGGMMGATFLVDSDVIQMVAAGGFLLITALQLLFRKPAEMVESQAEELNTDGREKARTFLTTGFAGLSFAMTLLFLFSAPREGWGIDLGLSPTHLFEGFWFATAAITLGYWLVFKRTGPPENLLEGEFGDWNREKDFTLMAAISFVIIGLLVVFL